MAEYRKKLIEVALPLEAINKEAAREKSIRHGHPSTLHLWWARRPLAACRAVLFASLVDDPSSHHDQFPTEEAQDKERQRLFRIIEELVKWENSNNETVLNAARKEILKSTNGHPPPALDPFCGGGSIPLEAQRLGLEAHASDLNPVAVLITKALIEIPPKFAGKPPVNPEARKKLDHSKTWRGAEGLAEDVRYYGKWMRDEAEKRIGRYYPKVKLPKEYGGGEATAIAWLWARTVECPNPACGAQMPLVRSFWLSTKAGKKAWILPILDKKNRTLKFHVETRNGSPPEGTVDRRGAKCIFCGTHASFEYIRNEGKSKRLGQRLMSIVAGGKGRIYLDPTSEQEERALAVGRTWKPDAALPDNTRDIRPQLYGMLSYGDLFSPRQLMALNSFCDLIIETHKRIKADAQSAGMQEPSRLLTEGGTGATAYADAVSLYLAFALDKGADYWTTICGWHHGRDIIRNTFARQAIPMTWDYAEGNPFSESTGSIQGADDWVAEVVEEAPCGVVGRSQQFDATAYLPETLNALVSTDPPYYGNIAYADLADFFYIWLRRSLARVFPDLFSTMLTPKGQELIAAPYRFGGEREKAERFFEDGLRKAFERMREAHDHRFPLTVFYAFRQAEAADGDEDDEEESTVAVSTGWETMLEGLLRSGLAINGTWPMRTEMANRTVASGANALASSVVLACRPRAADAPLATRREFMNALKRELPSALKNLQRGNIAPVDLAQAAIGPGMAVFSRYSKVVEADGSPMTVRTALSLINQTLDEVLAEQEGEFDADTRFAIAWFEQYGFKEGPFGEADVLARAKNTAVNGLVEAGIAKAKAGKVQLLTRKDLAEDWDPASDRRITIWEVAHYLIRLLEDEGESAASLLLGQVGALGETARDLAYRLYGICERKKWAQEALPYNSLVVAWPEIVRLSRSTRPAESQARLGI